MKIWELELLDFTWNGFQQENNARSWAKTLWNVFYWKLASFLEGGGQRLRELEREHKKGLKNSKESLKGSLYKSLKKS